MFIRQSFILFVILSVSYVLGNSVIFQDGDLVESNIDNVGETDLLESGRESARDPRFFNSGFLNKISGGIFGGGSKPSTVGSSSVAVVQVFGGKSKAGRCPGLFGLRHTETRKQFQQEEVKDEDNEIIPADEQGRFFKGAFGTIFGEKCTQDGSCPGQQKCCRGIFGLTCQNPSLFIF